MGGVCLLIGGIGVWKGTASATVMLGVSAALFVLGLAGPTGIDMLAIGDCLLEAGAQDQRLRAVYKDTVAPD